MTDAITKCVFGLGLGPKGTLTCDKPVVRGRGNCAEHLPERFQTFTQLVAAERERQIAKGYTPQHDDEHELGDFMDYIGARVANYLYQSECEKALIEIAALAQAAWESSRRVQRDA